MRAHSNHSHHESRKKRANHSLSRKTGLFKKINNGSATISQNLIEACDMVQSLAFAHLGNQDSLPILCPRNTRQTKTCNTLLRLFSFMPTLATGFKEYLCTFRGVIPFPQLGNS